jgi:hypothetical protein
MAFARGSSRLERVWPAWRGYTYIPSNMKKYIGWSVQTIWSTSRSEQDIMTGLDQPLSTFPEPLRGSDPESFAQRTVTVRMPDIARRTLAENDFPDEIAWSYKH